jgi:hypothetical protein
VKGSPCRRDTLLASSDDRDWVTFLSLASPTIVVGRWERNHVARVRFEKTILEAQCDIEIAPGVVLSAGRHTAVLRQQIIISTLSGPGRGPPRYLLDMNEISYDVTDLVFQKRLRPTP